MDKDSQKIIEKLISYGRGTDFTCSFSCSSKAACNISLGDLAESVGIESNDLLAAVRYLTSEGYLEYQTATSKAKGQINIGFHLSHKGLHWKYYRRQEILNYLADKWVDFFAAAISMVSLIVSIIALSQGIV